MFDLSILVLQHRHVACAAHRAPSDRRCPLGPSKCTRAFAGPNRQACAPLTALAGRPTCARPPSTCFMTGRRRELLCGEPAVQEKRGANGERAVVAGKEEDSASLFHGICHPANGRPNGELTSRRFRVGA